MTVTHVATQVSPMSRLITLVELRGFEPLTFSDGRAPWTLRPISVRLDQPARSKASAADRTALRGRRYRMASDSLGEVRAFFLLTSC